jgi:uncharacterized protein (TIGR02646 family)
MKAVPRLTEAPPGFAAYCADHETDVEASGEQAAKVWDRFRDDPAYKELRSALVAAQGGLCAYCEQKVTDELGELILLDQQVEHVKAKSGGSGRTLDWSNLVLCCGGGVYPHHEDTARKGTGVENESCGQRKGDFELPDRCDPRAFPLSPRLLDVDFDGTLSARRSDCQSVNINPDHLDVAINKLLNLNCERLRVARQSVANSVAGEFVWLGKELLSRLNLSEPRKRALEGEFVEGRLAPDERGHLCAFWTTERQYLEPWADTWLVANAHRFRCPPAAPPNQGGTP